MITKLVLGTVALGIVAEKGGRLKLAVKLYGGLPPLTFTVTVVQVPLQSTPPPVIVAFPPPLEPEIVITASPAKLEKVGQLSAWVTDTKE